MQTIQLGYDLIYEMNFNMIYTIYDMINDLNLCYINL